MEPGQTGDVEKKVQINPNLLKRRRFWGRSMIWAAGFVIVPPMLGAVGTVVGMVRAFGQLGATGQADPAELAGDISIAVQSTMWGSLIAAPAFVFLLISIVRYSSLPMLTPEVREG